MNTQSISTWVVGNTYLSHDLPTTHYSTSISADEDAAYIAKVYGKTQEESIALAELIHAAPELYKACKRILSDPHNNLTIHDQYLLEAAIAKAEGK